LRKSMDRRFDLISSELQLVRLRQSQHALCLGKVYESANTQSSLGVMQEKTADKRTVQENGTYRSDYSDNHSETALSKNKIDVTEGKFSNCPSQLKYNIAEKAPHESQNLQETRAHRPRGRCWV
jgi:hypothetical protein